MSKLRFAACLGAFPLILLAGGCVAPKPVSSGSNALVAEPLLCASATDAGGDDGGGSICDVVTDAAVPDALVLDDAISGGDVADLAVDEAAATDALSDVAGADAVAPDAAGVDAAAPDAGTPDVTAPDAGAADATARDAGAVDAAAVADAGAPDDKPAFVDITWMSISNIYYEIGPLRVLTDGYITRIPLSNFYGGKGGLAFTHEPSKPETAAVSRVLDALGGPSMVNLLLTGHSHFDHSFDTATWASLTGAPIIGSQTTCFQVMAQNIPTDRCRVVVGGEKITLASGVTMRVVRWNHSGDSVSNPEQHDPVELTAVPVPDPVTGGLHGGVAEDFPNGGGGRAFLFTVDGKDGPFSWFFQNSASPTDLAAPIVVGGVDYGAPLANLEAAMADAGLEAIDLWIGTGGSAVAQLVLPVIKPKAYLPVHWDGLGGAFLSGVPSKYSDSRLATLLSTSGVKLLPPVQYMDKWRLDRNGVQSVPNSAVKTALGFPP
jgi:hypothetical protein